MPDPLEALTLAQHAAVTHGAGALVVRGAAGTGKTRTLLERHVWLAQHGAGAPEHVLTLARTPAAADALRVGIEQRLPDGFEELAVHTVVELCMRLLRDEGHEAGLDPFLLPASRADRVAMLLEHIDELTLREHDFQGSPARLLGGVVARIDDLKRDGVTPDRFGAWSHELPDDAQAEREREFAGLFAAHDRLLAQQGAIDAEGAVLQACAVLSDHPHVRARTAARWRHVIVDDAQDLAPAQLRLVSLLTDVHGALTVAGDPDCAVEQARGAPERTLRELAALRPGTAVIWLEGSLRSPPPITAAAAAVVAPLHERVDAAPAPSAQPDALAPPGKDAGSDVSSGHERGDAAPSAQPDALAPPGKDAGSDVSSGHERPRTPPGGDQRVRLWRCANERAQSQAVATEIERLVRNGTDPARIAVLVRSVRSEAQAIAVALDERAVPHHVAGATLLERAEVRDVLAWLRLLIDPGDAAAVVRALARPPIELRSVDLARCIQIARRRKLDLVAALVAATESPQLPPEARERVLRFLKLHRAVSAALDTTRPDLFVHRLIDRLGLRRQQLFAAQADVVERLVGLSQLGELAAAHARRAPYATAREFARHVTAVADAGLDESDAPLEIRRDAVAVLDLHAAQATEFDHVFVVGLHAARMPGARRRAVEPTPAELATAALADDSRGEHVAQMRRLLHVALTRARVGVVLAHAASGPSGALQPPSPFAEEIRAALGLTWEERDEQLFGPDETLHATYTALRDELLASIPRTGGRVGELRLDTDIDVAHGTVRYLELVKLAALMSRGEGQAVADALPQINAALLGAATSQQREILQTSSLDELLLDAERDARARAAAITAREEPSLEPFLPTRGDGLLLSATDIETYRTCPLRYKFARVFRIPSEPTLHQRFGILVHQVLERYHQTAGESLTDLQGLLEAGWRRGGFGPSEQERQLHAKAQEALRRYHERTQAEDGEPMWFERSFRFKLGDHTIRGRVDRVDRLPDGDYELIDYKTGRSKTPAQLRDDVQLSLYAVAAREAWQLESSRQTYHYVLDDEKVRVPADSPDTSWIADTVLEVGEGIRSQGFEPTPSYAACSLCDYRIACPAAER